MNDLVTSVVGETNQVPNPVVETPDVAIEGGMPVNTDAQAPVGAHSEPVEALNEQEGTQVPPTENKASEDRLRQMQARNNKLLASLGLDPMSDLAEQLESGVITPEMLQKHMLAQWGVQGPQRTAQPTMPASPVESAQQRYEAAKQAYKAEVAEGGVSLETNTEYLEAMEAFHEAKLNDVRGQVSARQQQEQADENLNAILSEARSGEYYNQMSPDLQQNVDMVSVSLTGMIADREARRLGFDPSTLNAQQIQGFSRKAQESLNSLANYFIQVGEQRVRNGIRPANQQQSAAVMPVPANAGGNPAPTVNPYATVRVDNHQQMARQFVQNQRRM